MDGLAAGVSNLLLWSACLFLYQCQAAAVIGGLWYILIFSIIPSSFLLKLLYFGLLCFHRHFSNLFLEKRKIVLALWLGFVNCFGLYGHFYIYSSNPWTKKIHFGCFQFWNILWCSQQWLIRFVQGIYICSCCEPCRSVLSQPCHALCIWRILIFALILHFAT